MGRELDALVADVPGQSRYVRLLQETDIVAMIVTGTDSVITGFNRGAEKLLGYDAAEVVGKETPYLFQDAEEIDAFQEQLGLDSRRAVIRAMAAGRLDVADWGFKRKDGSRLRVAMMMNEFHDDQGRLEGYVGLLRDVTEVRAAELARQRAEARFRIAFEHAPIGLAIVGLTGEQRGRFLNTNPELARMVGRAPGDLDGVTIDSVTYEEDRHPQPATAFRGAVGDDPGGEAVPPP